MKNIAARTNCVFILFVCFFCGCSGNDVSDNQFNSKATDSGKSLGSCLNIGVLSCDIMPAQNLSTDACKLLQNCIRGRQLGGQYIEQVLDCYSVVFSADSELGSAASLAARLEVDGLVLHGSFLFVRFDKGWCPADLLHEPTWNHGGYCETQPQLSWHNGIDSPLELHIESQRICHIPLDQEELAAAESDIVMSECRQVRYAVTGEQLTVLSEITIEESCTTK